MHQAEIDAAIQSMDRIGAGRIPRTYDMSDWTPGALKDAVSRLASACTDTELIISWPIDESALDALRQRMDAQSQRRRNVANAIASALSALRRIAMGTLTPWEMWMAAKDLAATIQGICNLMESDSSDSPQHA